jgi:hypothetical protein
MIARDAEDRGAHILLLPCLMNESVHSIILDDDDL